MKRYPNEIFLFALTLISISYEQYIITANNYDKTLVYTFEKLKNCLNKNLIKSLYDIKINDISVDTTTIKSIQINSVSANLNNSYADQSLNFYIFSPYKLILSYSFNYKIGEMEEKSAELQLKIFDFRAKFRYKDNDVTSPSVEVELMTSTDDFKIIGALKTEHIKILQESFYTKF